MLEPYKGQIPEVSPREEAAYVRYMELLADWNTRINLVSRKSFENTVPAHLVDSIWIAHHAEKAREGRGVHDIGTGAGFPGVIYGIRVPEASVTLYEKQEKRRKFLTEVISELELKKVRLKAAFPAEKRNGLFLARAVFQLPKLLDFYRSHVGEGGRFVTMLGGGREPTPDTPGFRCLTRLRYSLPSEFGDRQLEVFERVSRGTKAAR